jgi:hypothetical protein
MGRIGALIAMMAAALCPGGARAGVPLPIGPEGLLISVTLDRGPGTAYREGEEIRVTVQSNRDCFLHLVYCDAEGKNTLIFPNASSDPGGSIRGGVPLLLGEGAGGFTFEVTAPFGAEMIRAYAAVKLFRTPAGTPAEGGATLLAGDADGVDVFFHDEAARVHAQLASTTVLLRTEAGAAMPPPEGRESATADAGGGAADDTPEIFALVVGVSSYRSKDIKPLRYADKDARLMAEHLASAAGAGIGPDHMLLLLNEQATREAILGAFRDFLTRSGPNDIVFLYFAGHGLTSTREQATYFLGYDAELPSLSGTAVDQRDIARLLTEQVRAGKIVFFLDACHGGGLGLTGARLRGANTVVSRALLTEMVTKKNGTVFLTASRAMEQSYEGEQWGGGHGVFTHYLVEGLRQGADADGNRRVTVDELAAYLMDKVKADTDGLQHPELKGFFDNNLVLSVLP